MRFNETILGESKKVIKETDYLSQYEEFGKDEEDKVMFEDYGKPTEGILSLNCNVIEEDYIKLEEVKDGCLAVIVSGFNSEYSVNITREQTLQLKKAIDLYLIRTQEPNV